VRLESVRYKKNVQGGGSLYTLFFWGGSKTFEQAEKSAYQKQGKDGTKARVGTEGEMANQGGM